MGNKKEVDKFLSENKEEQVGAEKRVEEAVSKLKDNHFFLLVDETEGCVLDTTADPSKAVKWYRRECRHQYRWYNPGVYAYNYDLGELEWIPEDAVPLLSTYSVDPVSVFRKAYVKRFPEKGAIIEEVEHLSL